MSDLIGTLKVPVSRPSAWVIPKTLTLMVLSLLVWTLGRTSATTSELESTLLDYVYG